MLLLPFCFSPPLIYPTGHSMPSFSFVITQEARGVTESASRGKRAGGTLEWTTPTGSVPQRAGAKGDERGTSDWNK